ncbi:hypothetical protein N7457_003693 [Penicillium paradoxum]|uniref:uncharacterized protein n=1 Tax=Penicillium paradoxum TaxID=176176 RepID=UPI0025492791|nr:uncharacterized protein N7457_003693 [Penicillium paradoxum]KAJ5788703.1 hypothetical protein N7457_003693 [Penicillium paradoxum]
MADRYGRGRGLRIISKIKDRCIMSKGDVKVVIIVSISHSKPALRLETVLLDHMVRSLRSQRPRYVPIIRQSITVSRQLQSGTWITVSPAVALAIEFKDLLCRQPVSPFPPEHNIKISPDRLPQISSNVWKEQLL